MIEMARRATLLLQLSRIMGSKLYTGCGCSHTNRALLLLQHGGDRLRVSARHERADGLCSVRSVRSLSMETVRAATTRGQEREVRGFRSVSLSLFLPAPLAPAL